MRKLFLFVAMLCMSVVVMAADEVYDTNFALASNGSSATASSGNAALAIDGNTGTRWESASEDPQTWTLDMGQLRIYNTIQIRWEGAYAKTFTIKSSKDGENWKTVKEVEGQTLEGFPYEQDLELAANDTARYIEFKGTARGTTYGYSFWEFRVLLPNVSVLTSLNLSAVGAIAKVGGEGITLTSVAKDQNGKTMEAEVEYEITPAAAGSVVNGKFIPAQKGSATIVAFNGEVRSNEVTIISVVGDNLALSTNIGTDNKIVDQSDFAPSGTDAFYAVDGNDGSVWQGSATNGTAGDEASRTYDAWFVVDLGAYYSIDLITIHFEGACSQDYHIDFSEDNTAWVLGYNYVGTAGINGRTDMLSTQLDNNEKVRYVRFWSTKAGTQWGMKMFEFQVFGQEWVDSGDTEAPVMVSATLVSKTGTSAVIAVSATDNEEVTKYHVVESAHGIDAKYTASEGKITINNLEGNTSYTFVVTALDAAQNESANSIDVAVTTDVYYTAPQAAVAAPEWPAAQVKAVYSPTYSANCNFQEWDSGTQYSQDEYGKKFALAASGYFGMDGFALNCLMMEKLHADIWIADDATLRLVPIYGGAGLNTDDTHGKMVNLTGGQWNSIDLDLATDYAGLNLASIFQFKIDNAANLTFWVGNLYFYRTTAIEDNEAPTNVKGEMVSAGYFSITLELSAEDNMDVVNFSVKDGETEVATGAGASGATVRVVVPGLQANQAYTFSVTAIDEAGNAAEAITVNAQTLEAPAPASVPTYEADKVLSIYSDVYTNLNFGIQGWYAEPAISSGLLATNSHALCIEPNTTPSSCFGLAFAATDITAYDVLEVDVYATAAGAVDIQVIGVGEASTPFNLNANQWNHIVLNISNNDKTNCEQIGFYNCNNLAGTCFIQNVIFVDKNETAIENVQGKELSTKIIENGVFYIIRNGIKYNVSGQVVR